MKIMNKRNVDFIWRYVMAETRLCPNCKEIMKPCCYAVGKQDGTERLENRIFSYDGSVIFGKLVVCTKCGQLSIIRY